MTNTLKIGICEGRHEIPGVTKYIFGREIAPELLINPEELEKMAEKALLSIAEYSSAIDSAWKTCAKSFAERISLPCIHVYATGLTVALLATLNALRDAGCEVIVMHYDREKGEYYPQRIA